ncbi:MAG: fibronectin type III domain-containing protein [Oscillospiraceae bacterium]|nr:fibronectin type III domain-containing protein [Oscillospiraceae bacterium]
MGTPVIKIVQEAYELTQWLAAQDNGFSRNRRVVLDRIVGMRVFAYSGVSAQNPIEGGTFNPLRRLIQGGDPNNAADHQLLAHTDPAIFNSRYDFMPQFRPLLDFIVTSASWCQRNSAALNRRLPDSMRDQTMPLTRTQILASTNPLNKDNPLNLHQDHYLMAAASPLEQALWGLLHCDPSEVSENLSWYYSTKNQFSPRDRYLTVSGATYAAAMRNFQSMAEEMRFGDGLPLIPPTRELVDEMLRTTNLTPDCVLGKLKMRGGVMTVETLAANAVMVGMDPEAFPVLVAGAQALGMSWEEDGHHWHPMTTASGPFTLIFTVSGPITYELGMENEINMLGIGQSVNNTMGRAFRMFYHNFAHNLLPFIDTHGRTGRMNDTFLMVIPENYQATRALGWSTHSENMGFAHGTNTVTITQGSHAVLANVTNVDAFTPSLTFNRQAAGSGSIAVSVFSPTHAEEVDALIPVNVPNGERSAHLINVWNTSGTTLPTPFTVTGERANENFPERAAFPMIAGPANGSSFILDSAGGSYRAGIWSAAVIHGTNYAPPSVRNTRSSPSVPQNVTVITNPAERTATLSWEPPIWDGGGIIERYEVFMYSGDVMIKFDWISVTDEPYYATDIFGNETVRIGVGNASGAAARSFTFENLVPGEQYNFRVRAVNDVVDAIYYINRQTNLHVGGVTGAPTGPLLGAPAGDYHLSLYRMRGLGAWGRAVCATRTEQANQIDGFAPRAGLDGNRSVRPIFSHRPIEGRIRPAEITAALQNLRIHAETAYYNVRLPHNVPFEISETETYLTLPHLRYRPGGDAVPQALLDFWAARRLQDFSLNAFNNGNEDNESLAEAGLIRIWPLLGGAGTLVPISAQITAVDQENNDAMQFITKNRQWCDIEGWQDFFVNFDADKNAQWQYIDLTVTAFRQTVVIRLINNRFIPQEFTLTAFNNGTCTQVPDLAGRIRIWPRLDDVGALVPMGAEITAVDQDDNDAMQFVTKNRQWVDGDGWQDFYVNFDVDKNGAWQYITFTVVAFGQTVEIILVNNLFVATPTDVLSLNAFNNGNDNNASLANLGVIRIWTQLNGVNTLVPYADLTVTATLPNGDCAIQFVRVNRIWNNLDYVNLIDVTKNNAPWQYIDLTVALDNQSVELRLINNTY